MKAFVLLALVGCASAGAGDKVAWTSGLRKGTSLALGAPMALAGAIEFKVTPVTVVPAAGTIKFTASQKTWENDAAVACSCQSGATAMTCTAAATGTGTILTVTMATG